MQGPRHLAARGKMGEIRIIAGIVMHNVCPALAHSCLRLVSESALVAGSVTQTVFSPALSLRIACVFVYACVCARVAMRVMRSVTPSRAQYWIRFFLLHVRLIRDESAT